MTEAGNHINAVEFLDNGLSVSYVRVPADLRKNGLLWQHNVTVPYEGDYEDEIEALNDALKALLDDVLDDEDRAEPIDLTTPDDEDEDHDDD